MRNYVSVLVFCFIIFLCTSMSRCVAQTSTASDAGSQPATKPIDKYNDAMSKANDRNAQAMLKLICTAEELTKVESGTYLSCDSLVDCNSKLKLTIEGKEWDYRVALDEKGGFCAQASGTQGTSNWHITEVVKEAVQGDCQ
jgi:hypothetical protein